MRRQMYEETDVLGAYPVEYLVCEQEASNATQASQWLLGRERLKRAKLGP